MLPCSVYPVPVTPKADISMRVAAIESDLRALAALAAKVGEWPVVRASSDAAESLAEVAGSDQTKDRGKKSSAAAKQDRKKLVRRSTTKASGYPRFEAENGDLVKIGWSRSEKAEYRHRAPEAAICLVANVIDALAKEGDGAFTFDDLFPIIDPADGSDVPTYQGYLIVRWFRELGLVDSAGRSGYVVPDAADLAGAVNRAWKKLCAKENG